MRENLPYLFYWALFLIGAVSYWPFFFVEYGFVYTILITFSTGFIGAVIALSLNSRRLIAVSVLLGLSPFLTFIILYIILQIF
ncbi:hypothetical protein [Halobacillus sp. A5]|uniref:hypothetical protein n=1 Tax=Halobacillus sp. A5 TaxID=2880263 RepID=UPI0020A65664|nr:hypothetical protein [Halobacillus sp. A5]MCP3026467.1 hypothetical protein [Halobacillus sp. A5]